MISISDLIEQKKKEQVVSQAPKKVGDYIWQKVFSHLDSLDSNVESVLSKAPLRINASKSGKSTRYELEGKPIEIDTAEETWKIPVSLIVYEGKEGIKEAYYIAQDASRNRVIMRYLVQDGEVQIN